MAVVAVAVAPDGEFISFHLQNDCIITTVTTVGTQ